MQSDATFAAGTARAQYCRSRQPVRTTKSVPKMKMKKMKVTNERKNLKNSFRLASVSIFKQHWFSNNIGPLLLEIRLRHCFQSPYNQAWYDYSIALIPNVCICVFILKTFIKIFLLKWLGWMHVSNYVFIYISLKNQAILTF